MTSTIFPGQYRTLSQRSSWDLLNLREKVHIFVRLHMHSPPIVHAFSLVTALAAGKVMAIRVEAATQRVMVLGKAALGFESGNHDPHQAMSSIMLRRDQGSGHPLHQHLTMSRLRRGARERRGGDMYVHQEDGSDSNFSRVSCTSNLRQPIVL